MKKDKANKFVAIVCRMAGKDNCFYRSNINNHILVPQSIQLMIDQSTIMATYTRRTYKNYNKLWVPKKYTFSDYSIDWEVSPLGIETILSMPDSI
jgi:hypothetical protein